MGESVVELDLKHGLELAHDVLRVRNELQPTGDVLMVAGQWWVNNSPLVYAVLKRYASHMGRARNLLDGLLQVLEHVAGGRQNPVFVETEREVRAFMARFPAPPIDEGDSLRVRAPKGGPN